MKDKYIVVNNPEQDKNKEDYCPQCYFEDDEKVLRSKCKHNEQTR